MSLQVENLSLGYGASPIIDGMNLSVPQGSVTAIFGSNGCGKSTLLRGLGGLIAPQAGRVLLEGQELARLKPIFVARRLALLPQAPLAPEGIRVAELVSRGRTPWLRPFRPLGEKDRAAVEHAMQATGVNDLHHRRVGELSGGQRQRVWIAMALAQDTGWLLLDEPTTWLDLPHQLEMLKLVRKLNRENGRSVVMVLHDVSLAARFADHVIALRQGKVVSEGPPEKTISAEVLDEVFGLQAKVIADPLHGSPLVLPL